MTGDGRRGRVVVVGSLNVDLVFTVPRHPGPGETVTGTGLARRPGGKGANQALGAAAAGADVTMVGRVGFDVAGSAYVEALRGHGVDVGHVTTDSELPTGTAIVVVATSGENSIVVVAGANGAVTPEDVRRAASVIAAADVLVVQFEVPMPTVVAAVRLAAEAGTRVVVNPSPYAPVPPEVLAAADPLVVNEHEATDLLGHAADAAGLVDIPARSVVMTLGPDGAVWVDPRTNLHLPSPPVRVVDTTGAGDAFTGALAAALASGASPSEALERAVAAGAAAVGHAGAQEWDL